MEGVTTQEKEGISFQNGAQELVRLFDSEWPRFGSVRLRFGGGKVRSVPVFGSGGSPTKRVFLCFSTFLKERTVPVPVSVPGKTVPAVPVPLKKIRFREKRFRRFRFPVPVRFLSHPVFDAQRALNQR